ncbi:NAD-dependent epimerase/dehydratase family protein [Soonwooa sp.]|uniref:NAD-dependent epimerase/dehydratase family protein n=1 Tax=Soonwooa sp. TaxID=1938592 RepID=UPI002637499E|nr:NAD-dependent epimerase/dehydratase family protein [Soonwooa sp.]
MEAYPQEKYILVTGATGILGRVIVLELLKQGCKVRATKRPNSNLKDVLHSYKFYTDQPDFYYNQIEWVDADFNDIFSLEKVVENVSEIYHCAAKVSFHPKDRDEMYKTNIEGTKNLLYAVQDSGVEKFCFVSSVAVLDGFNEEKLQDETCDFNSKLDHSAYAKSKHFSEMEIWRAAAEGLNVVIINPAIIVGSGNWSSSSGEMFGQLAKSGFSTDGSSGYIDVRDVAKVAVTLMDSNVFDQRFVLVEDNVKNEVIANKVRKAVDKAPVKLVSKSVLNIGRTLNALFGWLVPSLRMANKVNIEAITTDSKLSNKKIKKQLNFDFIPVSESFDFHLKNYTQDQ